MSELPRYQHSCPNCHFLGGFTLPYGEERVGYRDLYYCTGYHLGAFYQTEEPLLVQRIREGPPWDSFGTPRYFLTIALADYETGWTGGYIEAAIRASSRGLLDKPMADELVYIAKLRGII